MALLGSHELASVFFGSNASHVLVLVGMQLTALLALLIGRRHHRAAPVPRRTEATFEAARFELEQMASTWRGDTATRRLEATPMAVAANPVDARGQATGLPIYR